MAAMGRSAPLEHKTLASLPVLYPGATAAVGTRHPGVMTPQGRDQGPAFQALTGFIKRESRWDLVRPSSRRYHGALLPWEWDNQPTGQARGALRRGSTDAVSKPATAALPCPPLSHAPPTAPQHGQPLPPPLLWVSCLSPQCHGSAVICEGRTEPPSRH
ncbi:glycine receptor subunit alpha-2 [Platysternon megacephalum]|uniref:Glycine receptor subunit alpha-2 n=1 Tax=Platysternon megacephalum TaxID=55544 RepID=A0A4D9EXX7_9SAUR|nr:glycine receptor subunit alpha-2 [Platysternon megacephalum]